MPRPSAAATKAASSSRTGAPSPAGTRCPCPAPGVCLRLQHADPSGAQRGWLWQNLPLRWLFPAAPLQSSLGGCGGPREVEVGTCRAIAWLTGCRLAPHPRPCPSLRTNDLRQHGGLTRVLCAVGSRRGCLAKRPEEAQDAWEGGQRLLGERPGGGRGRAAPSGPEVLLWSSRHRKRGRRGHREVAAACGRCGASRTAGKWQAGGRGGPSPSDGATSARPRPRRGRTALRLAGGRSRRPRAAAWVRPSPTRAPHGQRVQLTGLRVPCPPQPTAPTVAWRGPDLCAAGFAQRTVTLVLEAWELLAQPRAGPVTCGLTALRP